MTSTEPARFGSILHIIGFAFPEQWAESNILSLDDSGTIIPPCSRASGSTRDRRLAVARLNLSKSCGSGNSALFGKVHRISERRHCKYGLAKREDVQIEIIR